MGKTFRKDGENTKGSFQKEKKQIKTIKESRDMKINGISKFAKDEE